MDSSKELNKVQENQKAKVPDESACCGPTCCGSSNKINNKIKESENGNSK